MKDKHYMFSLHLYFHLHNKRINEKYTKALKMQAKQSVHIGLHGKLTFRSEGNCLCLVPFILPNAFEVSIMTVFLCVYSTGSTTALQEGKAALNCLIVNLKVKLFTHIFIW